MTEPIRAVKALCQATTHDPERIHGYQVDALLAHGSEHGVVILPDGTLRGLKPTEQYLGGKGSLLYRLTDPGEPT